MQQSHTQDVKELIEIGQAMAYFLTILCPPEDRQAQALMLLVLDRWTAATQGAQAQA